MLNDVITRLRAFTRAERVGLSDDLSQLSMGREGGQDLRADLTQAQPFP